METALIASTALKFIYSDADYFVKGYEIGPTKAELADRARGIGGIDMMPNQAFDVGLFVAGLRGFVPRTRPTGPSLEGSAYELKFLDKHLAGTAAAEREMREKGLLMFSMIYRHSAASSRRSLREE